MGAKWEDLAAEGKLFEACGGDVRCLACAHGCRIMEGKTGLCRVRKNCGGKLMVPYGYVSSAACDPVEKKPFFHFLPGAGALSFGMLGCNFRCAFCQNSDISQISGFASVLETSPEELCVSAQSCGAKMLVSTYNEPLITAEWARAVFEAGQAKGLRCAVVSNGYGSAEVVDFLLPVIDAFKVDLKCFNDANYRKVTGGGLTPVLETIKRLHSRGVWVEVVTLVVPGFNDSPAELLSIAEFICGVSPDIPWHVTAFHPAYRMTDVPSTPDGTLLRAAEAGAGAGLRYVYVGNTGQFTRPGGRVGWEDTLCPHCGAALIKRRGFSVIENCLSEGKCPGCGKNVPGVWR